MCMYARVTNLINEVERKWLLYKSAWMEEGGKKIEDLAHETSASFFMAKCTILDNYLFPPNVIHK